MEFFKRLTDFTWERKRRKYLNCIYLILGFTFVAIIISDLVECRPFPHYWQVVPDPGPQCRQGYAQLLTLAASNVFTDLLLVLFPVPLILRSAMPVKRKVQLVLLFSLSLAIVAVTLYRVPHTIRKSGSQQYRSLMASIEILFAAAAANTLVLGSFVRDRGVKKPKFRHGSDDLGSGLSRDEESIQYRHSHPRAMPPALHRHWGSDEDLVRGLGIGLKPELRVPDYAGADADANFDLAALGRGKSPAAPTPAAVDNMRGWEFPRDRESSERRAGGCDTRSEDALLTDRRRGSSAAGYANRPLSFFDVGGLLVEEDAAAAARKGSSSGSGADARQPQQQQQQQQVGLIAPPRPGPARRGSAALLQDLGGFWSSSPRPKGRAQSVPTSVAGTSSSSPGPQAKPPAMPEVRDVGGLAS